MIIISGNMFVVFPFIRVLGVHGPCLLLKNETLFVVAYPTGLWKFLLQSPVKSEELVTEPLFYHDNIQVGNKTILHRRWIKKGVCHISHLLHEHGTFLCLEEFNIWFRYWLCYIQWVCYLPGCNVCISVYAPGRLWGNKWGYDTSIEENHGCLFQSHSNIGRHRHNPIQKEKDYI